MKIPKRASFSMTSTPNIQVQRSTFDLSVKHKTAFNFSNLVPYYVEEVLPGDTFHIKTTIFARISTPIYPIMDNMDMDVHFFFVANRIVMTNWVKLMGEQANPTDSIAYQTPIVTVNAGTGVGFVANELYDLLGVPTEIDDISIVNLVPRGYNFIYNEYYRDQLRTNSAVVDLDDGPDTISDYVLRKRCKRPDYFTTATATPQKGSAVTIALGTSNVAVQLVGVAPYPQPLIRRTSTGNTEPSVTLAADAAGEFGALAANDLVFDPNGSLEARLGAATGPTINDLRTAFAVQQLLERDMRGGTRYPEILMSQFGVSDPSMAVLNRPEYLGGSSTPLIVTPIAQTSYAASPNVLGDLGGMGTFTAHGGFMKSFTEHGHIIGIVSTRTELSYWQGIPRMYSRRTRYQFYMPVLAHLGEQSILNQEIFATEVDATNLAVFGYQERWSEYRNRQSKITGVFRPNHALTLAAWHLAQDFATLPTLNTDFLEDLPPAARVIAVTTEPHIIFDSITDVKAVRCMPVFSQPGLERL